VVGVFLTFDTDLKISPIDVICGLKSVSSSVKKRLFCFSTGKNIFSDKNLIFNSRVILEPCENVFRLSVFITDVVNYY